MRRACACVIALAILSLPCIARADEQTIPLATSGDWLAMAHSVSTTDAPDVCMAADVSTHFGIRIDDTGDIELRLDNASWSLPANVTGSLVMAVNGNKYSFDISGNTAHTVAASITQDKLLPLVADMEKAGTMTIAAGSAPPVVVPLNGSNTALTALLTCAGISAPSSNTGGSNPFSTSQ